MTLRIRCSLSSSFLAFIAVVGLSACTVIPGSSHSAPTSGTPASGAATEESTSQSAASTTPVPVAAPQSGPAQPLPSLGTLNKEGKEGKKQYQVDVNSVEVHGQFTVLTFTATLSKGGEGTTGEWQIASDFSDGTFKRPLDSEGNQEDSGLTNSDSTNGVVLIDPATGKRWTAAYDTSGLCMCSRNLSGVNGIGEGESFTLYTMYGALPEDISAVTIEIPGFGNLENIPVTRK